MANITPRRNKSGKIISYQIRVFRGRSADGTRLKDYMMTWKPTPGMTKRQIEKELDRQATLFEEACKQGIVATEKPTFEKYAEYVIDLKERNGLKAKTVFSYRQLLVRINQEIGPMKIQAIRPDHLNRFYARLAKAGEYQSKRKAIPKIDIKAWLKAHKLSQQGLADMAHIGHTSVGAAVKGNRIQFDIAEKMAHAMGGAVQDFFKVEQEKSAPLSSKTILLTHRLISTILEQAVKEQLVTYNAAKRATPPKLQQREMTTLDPAEVQAILEALEEEPLKWRVCVNLLIATGARRGEVMGLSWKNVDWGKCQLHLVENRVYTPATGAISNSLKGGESRHVTVSKAVMALLKQWRREQASTFIKLGIAPSGYIMTAENGGPMHPDAVTDWLPKFAKRHNLPPLHPHLFRHTQASLLISQGVDILTVSKRLGHKKVSTTLDIYSHQVAKSDERASEVLDELLYQKKAT